MWVFFFFTCALQVKDMFHYEVCICFCNSHLKKGFSERMPRRMKLIVFAICNYKTRCNINTLLYWFINGELIYFFSMRVQANWIEFIFSNCIKQNRENDNMDEKQYNVEEDILKKRSIQFILYTCSLSRKEIKLYIVH